MDAGVDAGSWWLHHAGQTGQSEWYGESGKVAVWRCGETSGCSSVKNGGSVSLMVPLVSACLCMTARLVRGSVDVRAGSAWRNAFTTVERLYFRVDRDGGVASRSVPRGLSNGAAR